MKKESSETSQNNEKVKIIYEPPMLYQIDEVSASIVTGGSNIYDDEDHEYSPDND